MKTIIAFKTDDGIIFERHVDAIKHTEGKYGALLTNLAHRAVRAEKYTVMIDFIESNLDEFVRLNELKNDTILIDEVTDAHS